MDTPGVTLKVRQTLNPATLLLAVKSEDLLHQCTETIDQIYSSRSNVLD